MPGLGTANHERLGAESIRAAGFTEEIATLVEMHVDAKRYLVASNPDYREKLSAASMATLELQGGVMTPHEAAAFESHPLFEDILRVRAWDEAAKQPGLEVPNERNYQAMMKRNLTNPISDTELSSWNQRGFLHITGWFDEEEMSQIRDVTEDIERWPEVSGKWMKYYEIDKDHKRKLCRIENFLQNSPVFDSLCRSTGTLNLMSTLMEEPAELYKEKINFKLSGGQGFRAHQDAPAFSTFDQHFHITLMLSIDTTNEENGCLEIAQGARLQELLEMNPDLTLHQDVIDSMAWAPIQTEPGDLVLFDSYLPHRSGPNQSRVSRRILYATYNRKSEGNWRDAYFEAKRNRFPPDIERDPGRSYDPGVFNVGNPVKTD